MNKIKISGDYIKEVGTIIGKISGNNIKDARGRNIVKIDKDRIRDSSGRIIGKVSGSYLKDSNGRTLSSMNDIRKSIDGGSGGTTLAAIWMQFIR